jgi:hypothetical protein
MSSKVAERQLHRRWRGVILEFIYNGLHDQSSRLDDLTLLGMMRDFGHDVGLNKVRALLMELEDAGYLRFAAKKNDLTNETEISKIEITIGGIRVVEKYEPNDWIQILG